MPDWHLTNPDLALALFQPHLSVLVSEHMPHKHAHDLLQAYFSRDAKCAPDKESFSTIWVDFIAPWFGLPLGWDESGGGDAHVRGKAPHIKLTPGQRVRTSVGDGEIVSVIERKVSDSFRYLVKFTFCIGYVQPNGVAHLLPSGNSSSGMDAGSEDTSQLMQDDIQVLFGTEKIYILLRLYILLVTMLYQAKGIADRKSVTVDANKSGYSVILSSLQRLVQGKLDSKDFEAVCRKSVDNGIYHFVAIPLLVERCAEALVKVATEDQLENLYHCSQLKLKVRPFTHHVCEISLLLLIILFVQSYLSKQDLNQLRNISLDMTDEAIYRLQIQSSASQVFFSYLPLSHSLHVKPPELAESGERPCSDVSAAKRPLDNVENCAANEVAAAPAQKRTKTSEEHSKPENIPS